MKDRILKLLGSGVAPNIAAAAVGCTPSYVSQLLGQQEFALEVATLRCSEVESLYNRDARYDSIEDQLLEKLENVVPYISRPRDIILALREINAAKRRSVEQYGGTASQQTAGLTQNIVVLQLPTKTVNTFELNKNNEVVSIGNKSLAAMPTAALLSSLRSVDAASSSLAVAVEAKPEAEAEAEEAATCEKESKVEGKENLHANSNGTSPTSSSQEAARTPYKAPSFLEFIKPREEGTISS